MSAFEPLSTTLSNFLPPPLRGHAMRPEQRDSDLARVVANDKSCSHIRWQASGATDRDVRLLAQALIEAAKVARPNTNLLRITLTNNPQVSDASITVLLAALPHSVVSQLELAGTAVSAALQIVARWVARPVARRGHVDGGLSGCIGTAWPKQPHHRTSPWHEDIQRVQLNDTKLVRLQWGGPCCDVVASDSVVDSLVQVLPYNTHLQCIDLRNNEALSAVGLSALATALPQCGVVTVRLDGTRPWTAYQTGRGARATVKLLNLWLSDHPPPTGLQCGMTNDTGASVENDGQCTRYAIKLIAAAAEGSQSEVKRVLERFNLDVASKDSKGRTALWHAASNGHVAVAVTLLQRGLDATHDRCDNQGVTPLIVAAANGHAAVASILLKAGANGRAMDRSGRTPLMAASRLVVGSVDADSHQYASGQQTANAASDAVRCVRNAFVGNACRRICQNDPELTNLDWSADDSSMCGAIDDSAVRALAHAIATGASAASAAFDTARAVHSDRSARGTEHTRIRGKRIPRLRSIDLRGSMQITDASLALLFQAISADNCGVIRVTVSITSSSRGGTKMAPRLDGENGQGDRLGYHLSDEDELSLVNEHVSEGMAEQLATACLSNTMQLLRASPMDIRGRLQLDWGRDMASTDVYEYGDDALDMLANTLVTANGGGETASISTLNLRHNQRVSRAACARLEPILAAAGVRCIFPDRFASYRKLGLRDVGPSLQRQSNPVLEAPNGHTRRIFTKV